MNRHVDVDRIKLIYVGFFVGLPVGLVGIAGGTGDFGHAWGVLVVLDAAAIAVALAFARAGRRRHRQASALLSGFAVAVSVSAAFMLCAALVG